MVRAGAFALGLKGAYVAAQFGVGVLLARALGPVGLGTYAFVMAVVQVLVIVGQWGIPALLMRRVAIDMQAAKLADVKSNVSSGLVLVTLTALTAGAAFFVGASLIEPKLIWASVPVIVLVITMALGSTIGGALRGFGYIVPSLLAEETLRLWLLVIVLAGMLALGSPLTARTALLIHAVCGVLALVAGAALLLRLTPGPLRTAKRSPRLRATAVQGFPFLLLLSAQTLSYQTDTIMLGLLSPGAPVGLYRAAFQVAEAVGILLFAISTVIGPHLARVGHNPAQLRSILVRAHRVGVGLVAPGLIVVLILGNRLLGWLFGVDFVAATFAMQILVAGKLFYASTCFVGLALSMMGRAWAAATISAVVIFANVALDLILIPRFGIDGAAIADATSNFLVAAGGALYLRRLFDGSGVTAFAIIRQRS
ncbi:oligosaccharide flippase family protein [Novosphingobium sp. Gsoil 351]|uniref:oligosaccharide flippase family protein n=1 Tax=Novosphingobium sp. Gsoil 351 TaxID=2675225 RepID=UPI002107AC0D|nr:oligosaccharide flippase family protein [Novosphingobium sp. Gsoil 351]